MILSVPFGVPKPLGICKVIKLGSWIVSSIFKCQKDTVLSELLWPMPGWFLLE